MLLTHGVKTVLSLKWTYQVPYLVWKIELTNLGTIRIDIRVNETNQALNPSLVISTGVWHHIAATFDGRFLRVYVDGISPSDGAKDLGATYYQRFD